MNQMIGRPRTRGLVGLVRAEAPDVAATLAELNRTFAEFREKNDQRIATIEARGSEDPLDAEQVARIDASLTEHQAAMDAINERLAAAQLGTGAGDAPNPAIATHTTAFNTFFRRGDRAIDADLNDLAVQASLQSQSDPDGGYVVPTQTEAAIDRVLGTTSAMRQIARTISIGAAVYKKPINKGGASSGWVGETDARPETNTPKLAVLEFPTMELYAMPAATQTLLDDASMNIEQWLAEEVSIEFAEQEGDAFINGDGVNQPRGLLGYDTVQNASYAWGKIGYIASGGAADFAASNPTDALIDLIHALKPQYRNNGGFLLNDLTVSKVRKFKDGDGNYLWQPSITAGQPSQLLGYASVSDDNMPDVGANAMALAFGDFNRAYLIVDRVGIRVLRDPYTSKPYVLFYTTKRVGGGIQNYEAVKLLKMEA
jgi:HK97 family phage major capsid protein